MFTIRNVLSSLNPFNYSNQKMSELLSSGRTRIPTVKWPQASRSRYQTILKRRIIRRRSKRSSRNTPLTYTTEYQLRVTLRDGSIRECCYGTLCQVLEGVIRYHTIGMNGLTLLEKSSPNFPHREGSYLLFSERWPSVLSRMSIIQKTHVSYRPTRPREEVTIVEIHSWGRAYSQPSMTSSRT